MTKPFIKDYPLIKEAMGFTLDTDQDHYEDWEIEDIERVYNEMFNLFDAHQDVGCIGSSLVKEKWGSDIYYIFQEFRSFVYECKELREKSIQRETLSKIDNKNVSVFLLKIWDKEDKK